MLKMVVSCLQDISAELVTELELNHVNVRTVEFGEDKPARLWCERVFSDLREAGIQPGECILIASDRTLLHTANGLGMKCIGYRDLICSEADSLLGCCDYVIESWDGIGFSYINHVFCRLEGIPLVIAETERLVIREMVLEDVPALCEICRQEAVRAFIRDVGDDIQEETKKHSAYIEQVYRFYDYGYWGVYNRKTGELIGRCGIQDCRLNGVWELELGYLLNPSEWGKGYATEAVSAVMDYAFGCLGITRIFALIEPENQHSVRVAERVGMKFQEYGVKNNRTVAYYVKEFIASVRQEK